MYPIKRDSEEQNIDSKETRAVRAVSKLLEARLLKSIPDLTVRYIRDPHLIEREIRLQAVQLGYRLWRSRSDVAGGLNVAERRRKLRERLGEETTRKVESVVQDIRTIKRDGTTWMSVPVDNTVSRNVDRKDLKEEGLPARRALPPPVAEVYFDSALMAAEKYVAAKTPTGAYVEERVYNRDWNNMLGQARGVLQSYRRFEGRIMRGNKLGEAQKKACLTPLAPRVPLTTPSLDCSEKSSSDNILEGTA